MSAHAEVCPWARRPFTLPVACVLGSVIGAASVLLLGVGPLSVVIALAAGIVTLRVLKLHMPPIVAISLLPQVIPHVGGSFVLAVAIGSISLTAIFVILRPLLLATGARPNCH